MVQSQLKQREEGKTEQITGKSWIKQTHAETNTKIPCCGKIIKVREHNWNTTTGHNTKQTKWHPTNQRKLRTPQTCVKTVHNSEKKQTNKCEKKINTLLVSTGRDTLQTTTHQMTHSNAVQLRENTTRKKRNSKQQDNAAKENETQQDKPSQHKLWPAQQHRKSDTNKSTLKWLRIVAPTSKTTKHNINYCWGDRLPKTTEQSTQTNAARTQTTSNRQVFRATKRQIQHQQTEITPTST